MYIKVYHFQSVYLVHTKAKFMNLIVTPWKHSTQIVTQHNKDCTHCRISYWWSWCKEARADSGLLLEATNTTTNIIKVSLIHVYIFYSLYDRFWKIFLHCGFFINNYSVMGTQLYFCLLYIWYLSQKVREI